MREVRYILLLLLIGLYAYEVPELAASQSSEAVRSVSSVINDLSNDYARRMQQQYDCTDALPSYQLGTRAEDNRLRTRRQERISTSWQLRTHVHDSFAALRYQTTTIAHQLNRIVARSRITPLSLPTEYISYPFHSFW